MPSLVPMLVRTSLAALVVGSLTVPALPAAEAAAGSTEVTYTSAHVVRWVDGDTVVTSKGTVRLVGVDTPEGGACGYSKATSWAKRWAPAGSVVRLGNPASVQDRDKYGRLLRYVIAGTRDVQRSQIMKGAKARYDGRDGYQWHPRQSSYRRADSRNADYRCTTTTTPTGGGSYAPIGDDCPSSAPIKGNRSSMIYHMPGQQYYDVTVPEECFATEAAAQAAGYRAAKV